jgi:RNA polymerase sigma-70 factor (ECF subfamily)
MGSQASDKQVMQQLIRGNDAALGELMRRWGRPLRCFVGRMSPPGCSCEDICQDIWIRVYRYRDNYRPDRPLRSYLFGIAINCCRTAIKQGRRGRSLTLSLDDMNVPSPAAEDPPALDELASREQTALLHQAIALLPSRQRAVVLLYLLCDTDYNRIAEILDTSARNARVNMHYALKKLRATLTRVAEGTESQVEHG